MATKFTAKAVTKALDNVARAYGSFKDAVDVAGAAVCAYALNFSNADMANALIERCGGMKKTAIRTNDLRRWLIAQGPFVLVENEDGKGASLSFSAQKAKAIRKEFPKESDYVQMLRADPFYSWKPQKDDWKGFDFVEAFDKLIEQATKANKLHAGDPKCKVTVEQIRAAAKAKARIVAAAA